MSDLLEAPQQFKPATAQILGNVSFLVLAIFPLLFSCAVGRAFAPLDGFCPLDIFHIQESPSTTQLLWWRFGSGAGYVLLAIWGVFQRSLAITVLVITSISPVLLFLRFVGMLSHLE